MDTDEDDILNDVINESRDHLANIEPDLLTLEQEGANVSKEVVNRIFRAIHSIKGGFSFFGKENITRLSHSMENILTKIRKGLLSPAPEVIDVLLQGVDKLQVLIDDINYSDSISIEEELKALAPFVDDNVSNDKTEPDSDKNGTDQDLDSKDEDNSSVSESLKISSVIENYPTINQDQLYDAIEKGLLIYELNLIAKDDFINKKITPAKFIDEITPIADIIYMPENFATIKNLKQIKKSKTYTIIITSVIEQDLISSAININPDQVNMLSIEANVKNNNIEDIANSSLPDHSNTEQKSSPLTKGEQKSSETLRVKVELLNGLVNLAGELVLGRNQLIQKFNTKIFENNDVEKLITNIIESLQKIDSKISPLTNKNSDAVDIHKSISQELSSSKEQLTKLINLRIAEIPGLNPLMQNIDHVTSGLQENIMQTRMQPIGTVFKKFPRIIRDLSKSIGKNISLDMSGEDVELDKSIIELLSDPLTHLIRNSVDHGIETIETRKKMNKSEQGLVFLGAYHEGGKVVIEITDDGAGINPEKIAEKAVEKGVYSSEEIQSMSDKDKQMIVFSPGFSTAEVVSDISGRGVGMDVVKTNIESLGGTIEIDSKLGKGTSFIMKLPLTLAIIPSLLVEVGNRRFAIPQVGIEELVRIRSNEITTKIQNIHGSEVLRLRDKLLPLVRLSDILQIKKTFRPFSSETSIEDRRERFSDRRKDYNDSYQTSKRDGKKERRTHPQNAIKLAVLKVGNNHFGLVVDSISNSEEIVVKPLSGFLKSCKLYSGCTILGNGTVAMILDPASLASSANLQFELLEKEMERESEAKMLDITSHQESILLFNNGGPEHFALPISKITRIEKIQANNIILIGNKEFLKYENYSIRLYRLHDYLSISPPTEEMNHLFVFLPKGIKTPVGILASNVEDVINTELIINEENVKGPGILGSAIIQEKMTLILDLIDFLRVADPELLND